jgi:hypothetical protein
MLAKCFRLKCFDRSPGLANDLISFSPKHRKHMVGRFFLNTDSVAASSACFSASAAATCGSTSRIGVELFCLVDRRPRATAPPSWNWQCAATALIASLRRRLSCSSVVPGRVMIVSTSRLCVRSISSVTSRLVFTSWSNLNPESCSSISRTGFSTSYSSRSLFRRASLCRRLSPIISLLSVLYSGSLEPNPACLRAACCPTSSRTAGC